jgi:peptide/nickel transport system substrate-binding protein
MRRKSFFFVMVLTTLLVIAAAPADAENIVRWASQGDALTADPMAANEATTVNMCRNFYGTLVARGENLKFIPWLATSWKIINPTTWEFNLRKGVKFQDGSPFTAEDVKFSFERALSKTSDFKKKIEAVKEVKIINDHVVHIVTDGPLPILPNYLITIFMMSKKWCEKHDVTMPQDRTKQEESYAVRHAMGTGPFKLVLREPDVRTVMVKNKDWWGLKEYPHHVDEVIYTPIANQATRVAALLSGEIDFLLDPPLQDLKRIEKTPDMRVEEVEQLRTIFLGVNQGRKELLTSNIKGKNPFADKRVRQAIYQAIDINAIKKKVMRGYAKPAGIITPPPVHGYTKIMDQRLPYDPAAAKKLLAEAGYPNGFSVQLDVPNNRYINDEAIGQAIVGMLAQVGIKVNLSAVPKTLHFPKIKERKTDFYMLGWGVGTLDSIYVFSYLVRGADKGWNGTGFNDPQVNETIKMIEVETDFNKRDAMIQSVWDRVQNDILYIPLHHQVIVWAMNAKIDMPIFPDNGARFFLCKIKKN